MAAQRALIAEIGEAEDKLGTPGEAEEDDVDFGLNFLRKLTALESEKARVFVESIDKIDFEDPLQSHAVFFNITRMGVPLSSLAKRLGVNASTIGRWARGEALPNRRNHNGIREALKAFISAYQKSLQNYLRKVDRDAAGEA